MFLFVIIAKACLLVLAPVLMMMMMMMMMMMEVAVMQLLRIWVLPQQTCGYITWLEETPTIIY